MTFEVAGRARTVDVHRAGDGWLVTSEGRRWSATLVSAGSHWSLLLGPVDGSRFQSHEVALEPLDGNRLRVRIDGRAVLVSGEPAASPRQGSGVFESPVDVMAIRAPMSGRVVRVLVEPGQRVATDQGLLVVEAMKMENRMRAPAAGVVRQVCVGAGASVEAGQLLVTIDARAS